MEQPGDGKQSPAHRPEGVLTVDEDTIRWHGVVLLAAGGHCGSGRFLCSVIGLAGWWPSSPATSCSRAVSTGSSATRALWGCSSTRLGWALAFRSGVGLLLTVLLIPPLVVRIRAEERMLRTEFGGEYDVYCSRTWRFIPGFY